MTQKDIKIMQSFVYAIVSSIKEFSVTVDEKIILAV